MSASTPASDKAVLRPYRQSDHDAVAPFWRDINRALAPPHMKEQFETYIATALMEELRDLPEIFSPDKRNCFWVVEINDHIIGTFGIQAVSDDTTELRRMYLSPDCRGRGLANRMLQHAEDHARHLGFAKLILSTAEIQEAALAFYRKSGYRLERTEIATEVTTKTIGGGLKRYHFGKDLTA